MIWLLCRVRPHSRQHPHVHHLAPADCPGLKDAIDHLLMHCVPYCIVDSISQAVKLEQQSTCVVITHQGP